MWQKAHQWVLSVYKHTEKFPKEEKYGLISQLRRSAVSVPANIAQGSLEASRYYLILAKDLSYLDDSKSFVLREAQQEIGRMLESYATSIKNSNS